MDSHRHTKLQTDTSGRLATNDAGDKSGPKVRLDCVDQNQQVALSTWNIRLLFTKKRILILEHFSINRHITFSINQAHPEWPYYHFNNTTFGPNIHLSCVLIRVSSKDCWVRDCYPYSKTNWSEIDDQGCSPTNHSQLRRQKWTICLCLLTGRYKRG